MRRKTAKTLAALLILTGLGCHSLTSHRRLMPDRVKTGINFAAFLDGEKYDNDLKKTKRAVSIVAHDLNPATLERTTRRGEFNFPQAELEYFLEDNPKLALHLKLGATYTSDHGKDSVYPIVPIRTNVKVDSESMIFLSGIGFDLYPIWHDSYKVSLGMGLEGYYYNVKQKLTIRALGIDWYQQHHRLSGFGSTAYFRAGIELNPKFTPEDVSFSFAVEHHFTIYDSTLDNDSSGTRFLVYVIKRLN